MSEAVSLLAEIRENVGTGAAREIRRLGKVPAIVYGAGKKPLNISVQTKEVTKLYQKKHFISTQIDLKVGNDTYKVLPKAIDFHPVTDIVRHLDFVHLEQKIQKMEVPIVYENREKSIGIKRGGFFNIIKRTLTILAPVEQLPQNIIIDISNMQVGHTLKSSSIKLPEGCSLYCKKEFVVASITGRGGKSKNEEEEASTTTSTPAAATKVAAPAKAAATKK